jgi:hypothetical protein
MKTLSLLAAFVGIGFASVQAQSPYLYQVNSGITSIRLDAAALAGIGLFNAAANPLANGSTNPQFGFDVGYFITPATDLLLAFSGSPDIGGISQLQSITGTLEHFGGLTVDYGVTPLSLGDFSISFDPSRQQGGTITSGAVSFPFLSGLVITDNRDLAGTTLFDIGLDGNPITEKAEFAINNPLAFYGIADLLVSPELASALGNPAAAGTSVGRVQINMGLTQVPEPAGALLVGAFGFLAILRRRR